MTPNKRQGLIWLESFPSSPRRGFEHVVLVPGDELRPWQQVGRLGAEQRLAVVLELAAKVIELSLGIAT